MRAGGLRLDAAAARLEQLIRGRGDYAHLQVRARAGHLQVEAEDAAGARRLLARATPIDAAEYGLSFRSHTGRWEPMPISGSLEAIVEGWVDFLGPPMDSSNLQ